MKTCSSMSYGVVTRAATLAALVLLATFQTHAESPDPQPENALPRREQVLAIVGDIRITVGDVEDALRRKSPLLRAQYRDPEALRTFVMELVELEILAQAAAMEGYGEHEAVRDQVREYAVERLVREQFDRRITRSSISEADIKAYFEEHRSEFEGPETIRASHILVKTKKQAQEIASAAQRGDTRTFRKLAEKHSLDTQTKLRGGDLGYFSREGVAPAKPETAQEGAIHPALVKAAFQLEARGAVSEPVEVDEFWSVVKLTGRRPAEHRTLAEVEDTIRERLWQARREQAVEVFLDKLNKRVAPAVFLKRLEPIKLDPPQES